MSRILTVASAIMICALSLATPALADSVDASTADGDDASATAVRASDAQTSAYTVSTVEVSDVKIGTTIPASEGVQPMTTDNGWGGTASSSGARTATISTKFYSLVGTHMATVKSGVYCEWSGGHVKVHNRTTPTLSTYNGVPLVSITMTYQNGTAYHFTWNGVPDGGWAADVTCYLRQSVLKYGTLGEAQVNHLFKVQANGRYFWQAVST